jgi:sugar-specific transcriptional regulator TrmB
MLIDIGKLNATPILHIDVIHIFRQRMLAKSLKTYREDVHRTLISLIEKGMVNSSLETPTVYAAVDLDAALDSALKKHESEFREMERRKRELQELP